MFRHIFSFGGALLLAGALLAATPASAWAQRGGRGGGAHFSGGRVGVGHVGGAHVGGVYRGGVHYGYHPGYNYGYRPYYQHNYGFYGSYYPYYGGYGYSSYPYYGYSLPAYSAPAYYGYYGSYPTTDPYALYGWSTPGYNSGSSFFNDATPAALSSPPTSAAPASAQANTSANVTVNVPAGATVSFNGVKMSSTGAVRQFQSPPLTPGMKYAYEVQASWQDQGQTVTQTQWVDVAAGGNVSVRFPTATQVKK
jgi:uncharacterized protein (TIGR03000 family)